MSLTTDERNLLQQAICDGAFTGVIQTSDGIQRKPLSPSDLKAIAAMVDEDVRVVLRAYQASGVSQLNNKITQANTSIAEIQAKQATLQAFVITPPPVAPAVTSAPAAPVVDTSAAPVTGN